MLDCPQWRSVRGSYSQESSAALSPRRGEDGVERISLNAVAERREIAGLYALGGLSNSPPADQRQPSPHTDATNTKAREHIQGHFRIDGQDIHRFWRNGVHEALNVLDLADARCIKTIRARVSESHEFTDCDFRISAHQKSLCAPDQHYLFAAC